MRHHAELRGLGELTDHAQETLNVGIVERRVDLVEDTPGTRLHLVDGEEQGDRREGFLTARQQADAPQFLASGAGDDLDV